MKSKMLAALISSVVIAFLPIRFLPRLSTILFLELSPMRRPSPRRSMRPRFSAGGSRAHSSPISREPSSPSFSRFASAPSSPTQAPSTPAQRTAGYSGTRT